MQVNFLSASTPIQKQYSLSERKKLQKESYPNIHRFTSYQYEVETIEDFFEAINGHAEIGNCLLKGHLQRKLENESRAGSTSPESLTQWICLDLDGVSGYNTVDEFLKDIGCGDTDYILQWSASQDVDHEPGELHCHVFMLLQEETHPNLLKLWLKYTNLSTTRISTQLKLARSQNALLWPLDITTCQNDKLLYIAPPIFGDGLTDPLVAKNQARISLVKKKFISLELELGAQPSDKEIQAQELQTLNRLRKENKLPLRRKFKYATDMDTQYLVNPEPGQYTGIKTERGFVYLNINGGDSWGYYHPVDNPAFIYNFKGEPTYRTQDILPAYWDEIKARVQNLEPDSGGSVYLAFRDFESATYWNGVYNSAEDRLIKLAQAKSESQLRHFMKQHGQPLGDFIPDWDMSWDPNSKTILDQKARRLNMYKPSLYFRRPFVSQPVVPPTIERVIQHALADDDKTYEHFLNWLAVIVQTLGMTQTAWVLHGTQGTGKGLLYNQVLTPLFGEENVTSRRMEELGSDFTEFMKHKFVVFIDEVQAGDSFFYDKIAAKLKNLIVEPRISVREMYKPSTIMANHSNLIFASNHARPVSIAPDDRRFNVAGYQDQPISVTDSDIDALAGEVGAFYDYLGTRQADREAARRPLETTDRKRIIDASRPSVDIAIEALKGGDLQFFVEMLVDQPELIQPKNLTSYDRFEGLLHQLRSTGRARLSRDELLIIMRWCVEKVPDTPNKFTAYLRHHNLDLEPLWVNGKTQRGLDIGAWRSGLLDSATTSTTSTESSPDQSDPDSQT